MAVATHQRDARLSAPDQREATDDLGVFGITGDLAKVMMFRSLYRLEKRGLVNCPIVGVAGNDWSVEQLRTRAWSSIADTGEDVDDEVFDRFADRLSYEQGDFPQATTFARVSEVLGPVLRPVYYLEIPPDTPGTWGPEEADQLLSGIGSCRGPWVAS